MASLQQYNDYDLPAKKLKGFAQPSIAPLNEEHSITGSWTTSLPEEIRYKIENYAIGLRCTEWIAENADFLDVKFFHKEACHNDHCFPSDTKVWHDNIDYRFIPCKDGDDCEQCTCGDGCSGSTEGQTGFVYKRY
jgi:hypothetical protein